MTEENVDVVKTQSDGKIALSSSAITAFEQCPWQFFELRKHRDLEKNTNFLELGNIVHRTLYEFHNPENTKSLHDIYKEEWEVSTLTTLTLFQTGLDMLNKYQSNYAHVVGKVIAREYKFSLELEEGCVLRGIFDRVDQLNDEGDYEIVDYKTAATPKTQDEIDTDTQLAIYDFAFRKLWEKGEFDGPEPRNVKLSIIYLRHSKITTSRSDVDREMLEDFLLITARQINNCTNPKCKLNAFCVWCMFKDNCNIYNKTHFINDGAIDFMDDEELMEEYKRLNYISAILDDRKTRITSLLKTKLEMMGISQLVTDNYSCSLQHKSWRRYDMKKLRALLDPLGAFEGVVKVNQKRLDKIADEYGLQELINETQTPSDASVSIRVKKL